MGISLWRLTHLWLAMVSSIFLLIASVTGAILAFEPIYENGKAFRVAGGDDIPIAQLIDTVRNHHQDIVSIARDKNGFIALQTLDENQPFYIDPLTGEKLGEPFKTPAVFDFCRTLHRSLFLGKTGRFLIGITSVFLLLISISGFWLILKKQGGLKGCFKPVIKNEFFKDYHTRLSRILIISLAIISLTGSYLFLERFSIIPEIQQDHIIDEALLTTKLQQPLNEFTIMTDHTVKDLRELAFPFSDFPEDYYELKLKDRELLINQFDGSVISEIQYPIIKLISLLSFKLHTGEGSVLWAAALGLSALGILFFIYSGFAIYLKRDKTRIRNPYPKDECSYVILVGSEQGNTFHFGQALQRAFLKSGLKSYISTMNDYEPYQSLEYLILLTSTYGVGEAPTNAGQFLNLLTSVKQKTPFSYAVVGFGSRQYPDFCQFAIDTHDALSGVEEAQELIPLHKIDDQSKSAFAEWTKQLSARLGIELRVEEQDLEQADRKTTTLKVVEKTFSDNPDDATFLLKLQASNGQLVKHSSGDIMGVIPQKGSSERLYSMSVNPADKTVLLSIRRHAHGLCSGYLSSLEPKDKLKVTMKENTDFHLPRAKEVIMIANGTGIAPFLGMIATADKTQRISLFWGGQNENSYALYAPYLQDLKHIHLNKLIVAFSRSERPKQYVQDTIAEELDWIIAAINRGAVIMMCGGLAMQKGVEEVLENGCSKTLNLSLDHFRQKGQIKADCY